MHITQHDDAGALTKKNLLMQFSSRLRKGCKNVHGSLCRECPELAFDVERGHFAHQAAHVHA
eukprot:6174650-Pleurochrysis_carterae.AAC.2